MAAARSRKEAGLYIRPAAHLADDIQRDVNVVAGRV